MLFRVATQKCAITEMHKMVIFHISVSLLDNLLDVCLRLWCITIEYYSGTVSFSSPFVVFIIISQH